MTDEKDNILAVPMAWIGVDELPVRTSNQVVAQIDRDHVYLVFGMAAPPMILGDNPEAIREMASRLTFVPVQAITRLSMSRAHLTEVIDLLQRAAQNFDNQPRDLP